MEKERYPTTTESVDNRKILIIDDDALVIEALTAILEFQGYNVTYAITGTEGLANMKASSFGLLILDLKIPDISGFDILQTVQKEYPLLKVIIITGYGTMDNAKKSILYGASAYFDKPIDIQRFVRKVKDILPLGTWPHLPF